MRATTRIWVSALIVSVFCHESRSADFQNLDFESAKTNEISFQSVVDPVSGQFVNEGSGSTAAIIPLWHLELNGSAVDSMFFNARNILGNYASLLNSGDRRLTGIQPGGRFGLYLGGLPGSQYSLSQQGTIPTGAKTLDFDGNGNGWVVSFNGNLLAQTAFWHYDISSFAGQTGALRFTPLTSGAIDSIRFVNVPEPTILSLVGLSIVAGAFIHRRSVRRDIRRRDRWSPDYDSKTTVFQGDSRHL